MKTPLRLVLPAACLMTASFTMPVFGLAWEPLQTDAKPPTSQNQKNNKSDLDLTANIRKAIMAEKTLSTAAHNVKIISQDGRVTMRGAVNSQDEKDTVLAKAREIAGADNVTDDVKIVPPKSK
jgi:hyperosmotically inducible protein